MQSILRFLLSLVLRLRFFAGRITLVIRARVASLWRAFTFAIHHGEQPRIRILANDIPPGPGNSHGDEGVQLSEDKDETKGTLAAMPVRQNANWQEKCQGVQALTSASGEGRFVFGPATPDGVSQRYKAKKASSNSDTPRIPPGPLELYVLSEPSFPDGWKRLVHPEGNIVYYHQDLRIFTENDILQCGKDIVDCAKILIQQAMEIGDNIMDDLTEIVLNVDKNVCHYYFVDHTRHLLFWVREVDLRNDLDIWLQGVTEYNHIRYYVESQYWYSSLSGFLGYVASNVQPRWHCEFFPHGRILPKHVYDDLRGMLNFSKTDTNTGDSSLSPFAQGELVSILDLVNSFKDGETISDPNNIWIITRYMAFFTENKFYNFAGQACARLNADSSLFKERHWDRIFIFRAINILLFGSPNEHSGRLKRVWVDGTVIQPRWKDFVTRITTELGRYTIFSTVMLAVNFSFLAVPGVVTPNSHATSIQIIIYCSIVSTVASIVFSFALLNVYSDPGLAFADRAANLMQVLGEKDWGMACLAITHSLPIASLEWSIMLFFTALAIQIFYPKDRSAAVTLGVLFFVFVLFAAMSVLVMRLFYKKGGADNEVVADDAGASEKMVQQRAGPQGDLERGTGIASKGDSSGTHGR